MLQLAAVIESIAFLLTVNLSAMQQSAPLIRIAITGGLSNCDYLCRALADLSGLVVERYALREATARGIAYLAAGEPDDWQSLPVDRAFTPAANEPLLARYANGGARWTGAVQRHVEKIARRAAPLATSDCFATSRLHHVSRARSSWFPPPI